MRKSDPFKARSNSILVVEDDLALGNLLVEKLRGEGHIAIVAPSAQEALMRLRNQHFDCVVLDMVLDRGGSGEQIIHVLKSTKPKFGENPTRVIVTSGSLDEPMVRRLVGKVGSILVKPYDLGVLLNKVRSLFEGKVAA